MNRTWRERAKDRMKELGVTQDDLREAFGVSTRGAVGHYLSGRRNPSHEQLISVATALDLSLEYLLTGSRQNIRPGPAIKTEVPLISWVQAGQWCQVIDNGHPGDGGEKLVPVTKTVSKNSFALRVQGDSMEPVFPAGSIIVVDPEKVAENGSYVVVRLDDENEATFKQLVVDAGKQYLKPLNPRYPIMEVNGHATICGVVRQMVMDFD